MNLIRLQHEAIQSEELLKHVQQRSDGAVALFLGTVRDHNLDRDVTELSYSAYEELARRELERVCEQAQDRFEIGRVAAVHRLGLLQIEEVAVAVAVAAPHRAAAFDGCRFIMDQLKQTVPIWKRERFVGGEEWIEGDGRS